MSDAVQEAYPAWYPCSRQQRAKLTPYQVQRSALAFLLELGTPASKPRLTEEGKGRQKNYCPPARVDPQGLQSLEVSNRIRKPWPQLC